MNENLNLITNLVLEDNVAHTSIRIEIGSKKHSAICRTISCIGFFSRETVIVALYGRGRPER